MAGRVNAMPQSGNFHAKPFCMARSAITLPHSQGLEACALLVCHRRMNGRGSKATALKIVRPSKDAEVAFSPLLPQSTHTTITTLCVLGWQIESSFPGPTCHQ